MALYDISNLPGWQELSIDVSLGSSPGLAGIFDSLLSKHTVHEHVDLNWNAIPIVQVEVSLKRYP